MLQSWMNHRKTEQATEIAGELNTLGYFQALPPQLVLRLAQLVRYKVRVMFVCRIIGEIE